MNISAGTIARTAVLALALTNQVLSAAGKPVIPLEMKPCVWAPDSPGLWQWSEVSA